MKTIKRSFSILILHGFLLVQGIAASETILEERFGAPLESRWEISGPGEKAWGVDMARGFVFSEDNIGGRDRYSYLTVPLDSPCDSWTVTLRYGWLYGDGESNGRNGFAVLDDEGNGYGLYIEQGSREASIQLMKFTGGSSFEIGTFDKPFNDTGILAGGQLTPLRLQWTSKTGELSLFLGNPGEEVDLVSELLGAVTDGPEGPIKFNRFQLQSLCIGGQQSVFSEIEVKSDTDASK